MNTITCIVIVGKPGAGKSSIGTALAALLKGSYVSLGGFMRETLRIPDPHIGVDKCAVYARLCTHLTSVEGPGLLVLDCHPYPEADFEALMTFLKKPEVTVRAIIHVSATDNVALRRLERRPRPGQTNEERLAYFNENMRFITKLMRHPSSVEVENNIDSSGPQTIRKIAERLARSISS